MESNEIKSTLEAEDEMPPYEITTFVVKQIAERLKREQQTEQSFREGDGQESQQDR